MPSRRGWLAAGLIAGVAADELLGDPQRWHPVAGYGRAAGWLERRLWADRVDAGAVFAAIAVGLPVVGAVVADRGLGSHRGGRGALLAVVVWASVGGRQLREVGERIGALLEDGDLDGARGWLPWLVGRDPSTLDVDGVARAVVESLAENTADSVVGPLVWGALLGTPGVVRSRAINTLDAMVGHRSPRYERFGMPSARLDDLANLLPSRVTAAVTALVAPVVGGSPGRVVAVVRRDGRRHPSPNAGPVEAAAAGALGLTLGGPLSYEGRAEQRGPLGDGPTPTPTDIPRSMRLSRWITVGATVLAAVVGQRRTDSR